jgi:hypothetical protein
VTLRSVAPVDREIDAIVRAKRLRPSDAACSVLDESALTEEQRSNLRSKRLFVDRIHAVLGDDESIRDLALFFKVKKSTLHERMREPRTDLRPLDDWFEKLDRYAEFEKLNAEFCAVSA